MAGEGQVNAAFFGSFQDGGIVLDGNGDVEVILFADEVNLIGCHGFVLTKIQGSG